MSLLALRQDDLDDKCLSFFELTGIPNYVEGEDLSRALAATYNLETGTLRWLKADGKTWGQLSLRRGRLTTWEPVTPNKLALIGLELGVISNFHVPSDYPGRFEAPEVSAVTVSPDGVVLYRDIANAISISDVTRLTGGVHAVLEAGGTSAILDTGEWTHFHLSPQGKITSTGSGQLQVEFSRIPAPTQPGHFGFTSLAECSQLILLDGSGHTTFPPFTEEAAAYVEKRYGVNPHEIDRDRIGWTSANMARLRSRDFTEIASFDYDAAIAALRLAVASEAAQSRPATPTNAPSAAAHDVGHRDIRPPQTPIL